MKNITKILTFVALLNCPVIFGQTISKCDTIYDFVEQMPKYDKDMQGLMEYIKKDLIPIISECVVRDSSFIVSMQIVLTISKNGQVIDATIPRPVLLNQCQHNLKKKLLTMTGWIPGQHNGKNVCSHIYIPIHFTFPIE